MKKQLLSFLLLIIVAVLQAQTVIYVKPEASGSGLSWGDACDLEVAVQVAAEGSQIWVQQGVHYPSRMLRVPDHVKLYGGFVGTETALSQRDIASNQTIIDAQRKYGSVVRLGKHAMLSGFIIQNGFSDGHPNKSGGGVWADANSVIEHCLLSNNHAVAHGGGVYAKSDATLIGNSFSNNTAQKSGADVYGGCILVEGGTLPPITSPTCISPFIFAHPNATDRSIPEGHDFAPLTVLASGTGPLTYQWYSDTISSNTGGVAVSTGNAATFTASSSAAGVNYYYCVISNSCGSIKSNVSGAQIVLSSNASSGCNLGTPGWGAGGLGIVDFVSSQIWTVGGLDWSDAVVASNCNKTTFYGGSISNYNTDCRSSNDPSMGNLFSWCAVVRYGNQLCPGNWRVPTADEYKMLNKELGGQEVIEGFSYADNVTMDKYTGTNWGAVYNGYSSLSGTLAQAGSYSYYWTTTEYSPTNAKSMHLYRSGHVITPESLTNKYFGFALRCVKNSGSSACVAPLFTAQPSSTEQNVGKDSPFSSLSVAASGSSPLTYAWYVNNTNSNAGGLPIPGANGASYTPPSDAIGTTYYYCKVSNACGAITSNSSAAHTVSAVSADGCNTSVSGWGSGGLGMVSRGSAEITISNNGVTQIWSEPITAANCNKTIFNGGVSGDYNADCRSNPDFQGSLFSWCVVSRFASVLCPAPWRVPTTADFCALDKALGGSCPSAGNNYSDGTVAGSYIDSWKGQYGGFCDETGVREEANDAAYYWSATLPAGDDRANYLTFANNGSIAPQQIGLTLNNGLSLRCVKDANIDANSCNTAEPEWGADLGTVTFKTENTYQIGAQEWSDAVVAENCGKTTYDGGLIGNYNADCKTSANGSLFSWCAVVRFADEICPDPWRVPTTEEYRTMNGFLGGTSIPAGNSYNNPAIIAKLRATLGSTGQFWGAGDETASDNLYKGYWSSSELHASEGNLFDFHSGTGDITPQKNSPKENGFLVRCVRNRVVEANQCNTNTAGWGANGLGTISQGTTETTISGNGVTQIWSEPVTAENCNKTTFYGGTVNNYSADCRSNPGFPGDLFSWCAIVRHADQLCPAPWRVPTAEDFAKLDTALGGNGLARTNPAELPQYTGTNTNQWQGTYAGHWSASTGVLANQASSGGYWTKSEINATNAAHLSFFLNNGAITPKASSGKNFGYPLRCVKD